MADTQRRHRQSDRRQRPQPGGIRAQIGERHPGGDEDHDGDRGEDVEDESGLDGSRDDAAHQNEGAQDARRAVEARGRGADDEAALAVQHVHDREVEAVEWHVPDRDAEEAAAVEAKQPAERFCPPARRSRGSPSERTAVAVMPWWRSPP